MSHPIDCDPETSPRVHPELCASTLFRDSERSRTVSTLSSSKGRRVYPEFSRRADSKHLKLLETLIDKIIKRLADNSCQPKIRDALKAIKLKQDVVKTSEAEKIFWQEIESIRTEIFPKLFLETVNLEDQIQRTILGLRHQVKNGILPVKTITDTFNQGRSKGSQLTYHRIGRLLSTMGFRKAKTQSGSSAILWDDRLLQNV